VFDAAVEDRIVSASPCRRITLPKSDGEEVVPPTVEEVAALRSALDQRWRAVVVTLAGSGLRVGELLGLSVSDVDFLRKTIRVERQRLQFGELAAVKSKTSRRTVPVGQVVVDELAAHLAAHPSDDALFMDEWALRCPTGAGSDSSAASDGKRAGQRPTGCLRPSWSPRRSWRSPRSSRAACRRYQRRSHPWFHWHRPVSLLR
jgi:integrase